MHYGHVLSWIYVSVRWLQSRKQSHCYTMRWIMQIKNSRGNQEFCGIAYSDIDLDIKINQIAGVRNTQSCCWSSETKQSLLICCFTNASYYWKLLENSSEMLIAISEELQLINERTVNWNVKDYYRVIPFDKGNGYSTHSLEFSNFHQWCLLLRTERLQNFML